jgi:AmiR/NasT family two-component response regulator
MGAMRTRAVIAQAKGILIERLKITEDMAFTVLSRASQNSNVKVHEVPCELVVTGVLHGSP